MYLCVCLFGGGGGESGCVYRGGCVLGGVFEGVGVRVYRGVSVVVAV